MQACHFEFITQKLFQKDPVKQIRPTHGILIHMAHLSRNFRYFTKSVSVYMYDGNVLKKHMYNRLRLNVYSVMT